MKLERSSLSINELIRHITGILLKEPDIDSGINQSIKIIREVTDVDRVYIFELWNDPKLGLLANQIYENCAPGVHAEIDNQDLQGVVMQPHFDRWISAFQRNSWISGHIEEFPKTERDMLEPQGIKSILIIPVRVENQMVGFMGFDSTTVKRTWMLPEVELLIESSVLIGTLLLRREQEARLKAEDSRYMDLFQNMSDGVVYHEAQGAIKNANKAACDILGLSRDELLNRGATDLEWKFLHEDNEPFAEEDLPFVQVVKTGKPVKDVVLGIHSEALGKHRWLSVSATPEFNGKNRKKVTGVYTIFRDISERIEFERQLIEAKKTTDEVSRLKTNIITNIDHEFRTPLTGILGFSSIIAKDTEEQSTRDSVRFIETSARRLQNTLESLLEFAHYDVNSIEFRPKYILVSLVLNPIIESFRGQATTKGLGFKYSFTGNDYIYCDERFLRSIIRHLLSNAIKFTQSGEVRLDLLVRDDQLQLTVSDTGIGIQRDQIRRAFEPFSQVSDGIDRNFEGFGLGLSIVKRLTDSAKGQIDIAPNPIGGTIFQIEIPLKSGTDIETSTDEDRSRDVFNARILYVEDNPVLRKLVKSMLPQLNITTVPTAEQALLLAEQQPFDILLIDINLGSGMDGIELAKTLRATPGFEKRRMIAITAYSLDQIEMAGGKNIFNHYVSKPFSQEDLTQAIQLSRTTSV